VQVEVEAGVEPVLVRDEAALAALVEELNSATHIAFDVETTSTDEMAAVLVGIALATNGERGYYIPVGHLEGQQLPMETVINAIRPALTNPAIGKIAHNATYDLVIMQRNGIDVSPITFDTMVAEWLRDPTSKEMGLKKLVLKRFGIRMTDIDELIGKGKKQITMDMVPAERAGPYAAADAALTMRLMDGLRSELEQDDLLPISDQLEMPLVPVIADMQRAGVMLNTEYLAQLSEQLGQQLAALETEIRDMCNAPTLNINSPKQLNDVLFGTLALKAEGIRKTAHGFSTAADVLENLRGEHPVIEKILQYREISKLQGTYVDALPALINPDTGRVHTDFNQAGSATGRMSSSNPNLQNIPIRTEAGRDVRRAFITPDGTWLLAVDYSQVELRILAHVTKEPTLLEAFRSNLDIHAATAAIVYNIPVEEVTKAQRNFAKRVNFGVLYGMGAFRLARDSNLTLTEARQFIDTYFSRLPNVLQYIEDTKRKAKEEGFVETLFGRKRRFPNLKNGGGRFNDVQREEREAINMPIQGTAADIMKKAMIELYGELKRRKLTSHMILQVHDELVLEVPQRELDEVAPLVVGIMESTFQLEAPLKANAQYGSNWLDMQPAKL
jgi:DNA polymerase I